MSPLMCCLLVVGYLGVGVLSSWIVFLRVAEVGQDQRYTIWGHIYRLSSLAFLWPIWWLILSAALLGNYLGVYYYERDEDG